MDPGPVRLRITTLNLLHDAFRYLGAPWTRRRPLAVSAIRTLAPDVLCLQEVSARQLEHLREDLPEFEVVTGTQSGATCIAPWLLPLTPLARAWCGDYTAHGEWDPILLRRGALERVADGTFALEERQRGWSVETPHMVTWVRARLAGRPAEIVVHNTHLGLLMWRQMKNAHRVTALLDRTWDGTPQFLAGDFNAEPHSAVLRHLLSERNGRPGFRDLWTEADERVGAGGTYESMVWLLGRPRIDYVLGRPAFRTLRAESTGPTRGDLAPSDHRPVTVEVALG